MDIHTKKKPFTKIVLFDNLPTVKPVVLKHLYKKSHHLIFIQTDLESHNENNQRNVMVWKIQFVMQTLLEQIKINK